MVFSLKNEVGCLVKALQLFQVRTTTGLPSWKAGSVPSPLIVHPLQEKRVNLNHIESRVSKRVPNEVEIFADCNCSQKEFEELLQFLRDNVSVVSTNTPAHVWADDAGTQEHVKFRGEWAGRWRTYARTV